MKKKRAKVAAVPKKRPQPRFDTDPRGRQLYLVSGDLRYLFKKWADSRNLRTPSRPFFKKLRREFLRKLQAVVGDRVKVVYLPWDDIAMRVLKIIRAEADGVPVVSLDPVYAIDGVDISFETTRMMKHSKHSLPGNPWENIGYGPRFSRSPISVQLEDVRRHVTELRKSSVVLADDGVWSRGSIAALERSLDSLGVKVSKVLVAINVLPAVVEPGSPDATHVVKAPIISVWEPIERKNVYDWVCERDFHFGIQYAGRTIGIVDPDIDTKPTANRSIVETNYPAVSMEVDFAAPYLSLLGDPVHWASIPADKAIEFSLFCLRQSRCLFEECRRINSRQGVPVEIYLHELPRIPYLYRTKRDWPILEILDDAIGKLSRGIVV